nr:MAG TPA: tail tape measure protein [Caudoviricetes sp.]
MALSHNPDAEVIFAVTGDNSEVKQVLDETESKAEKTAKETGTKIGDAADAAAEKVKKKSKETRDQLASDTQKAGKQTEQTAKDTTEKVKKQFEAGSVAIGNIISGLVTKIASAGKGLIDLGVAYNAQIETYRTGLTNMLGDAEKANTALENIKQDAARTPFDTASLVSANQYLISAGENAEYSRKTILALGDAVSATGGGSAELERMAQNLQQVANVGKASSVDIKQFAFAGINIYQVLADYTGKSIQDVQNMTISYDLLTKSLQAAAEEGGRYYNSMGTQSETFNGSLSTLKDNASQLLGTVTEGLSGGLGEWMQGLNQTVLDLNEGIQNGTINFEGMFSILGAVAGALLTYKTYTTASTIAQNLLNAAMNANPIGIVVSLLGALAGGLVTAYTTSDTFRKWVSNSFQSVKTAAEKFISPVISLVERLISLLDRASFAMNKALGKDAVAQYSNYEEYLKDKKQKEGGHARRSSNQDRRNASSGSSGSSGGTVGDTIVSSIPSSTSGDASKKTKSTAKKTAKVIDSLSETSHKTAGKITTDVQKVTEKYDDGTKKITTTTTQSEKKIIDGVEQTVKTVTTEVDDGSGKIEKTVKKTVDNIEQSVDVVEKKIKSATSEISSELSSGIFGIIKSGLSDVKSKNWSGLALDVAKLIWGEVDQSQRLVISEWAQDVLKVINEQYASGGISSVISTIKTLVAGGELTTSGGTALASISKIVSDLTASGGMGEVLGTMATKLGSLFGTLATKIGSVGTALSGFATKLVGVIAANPEIFAILAIVAGVAALGAYIWKKHGKEISGWWSGLWADKPTAAPASNYQQSDSITAARLVQASQAAAAANQQSTTRVQSGTGTAASQQLNASWRGSSTTILNLDGREVARSTAPYMDEELAFRS